jgi:hypothetical protein
MKELLLLGTVRRFSEIIHVAWRYAWIEHEHM